MPSSPRNCPECGARLNWSRARDGKVRCPECDRVVRARDEDESREGIQSRPGGVRVGPPSRYRDEDPLIRKKQRGSAFPVGCVLAVVAAGVLGILVLGGGAVALWYAFSASEEGPAVAKATPGPAADVPGPQNGGPWPEVQPVKNAPPAEPAREPIQPAQAAPGGEASLPLQELKAATVYIKNETPNVGMATGSGFAIRSQGDTVLIVTNHHVIEKLKPEEQVPMRRFGPPRGPRFGGASGPPQLTVVFRSGTPQQQERPAVVVADDSKVDLALLRVMGVREPPSPIDIRTEPKLVETKPVIAFGFPFGALLDPDKGNPAITITRGAVTSLRMRQNELAEVQVDCDINPGNSGGPIVDDKGVLVGVAVKKVVDTKVGFAIPSREVKRLLNGHIDPPSRIHPVNIAGQGTQVQVVTHVSDPLGNLRSPVVLYAVGNEARLPTRRGNGEWQALAGARSSRLQIEGTTATAVLDVQPPQNGDIRIVVQASYQDANGQPVYGEPRELRLTNAPALPAQAPQGPDFWREGPGAAAQPAPAPLSRDVDKLLADLKSQDQAARQAAATALVQAPHKPSKRSAVRAALLPLLTIGDAGTRAAAVRALGSWDPKEAAPELTKLLNDPDQPVRTAVLEVLRDLKDARGAEAVAARLENDPIGASEALKAMGPAAEKAVLPYLSGPDSQARFWAFGVIKEIGGPESIAVLEKNQGNGTQAIFIPQTLQAVRARLPIKPDEWPQVLEEIKSPDIDVRRVAIGRIAATPPEEARRAMLLPQLELLMNDHDDEARKSAMKAYLRWGGKSALPVLARRMAKFDPFVNAVVLGAIGEMKSEEAAAVLAGQLPNIHHRAAAAQALKRMGPVAEKSVLPVLNQQDAFLREECCKILAEIGGRDSISPLERLVQDENQFYGQAAQDALEVVKDRVALAGKP